jgi:hypothetical protein
MPDAYCDIGESIGKWREHINSFQPMSSNTDSSKSKPKKKKAAKA